MNKDFEPILIDCDDVLLNLLDHWIDYLNDKYQLNYSANDIKSWDISKWIPELTRMEIMDCLYQKDFYDEIEPIAGSYSFINKLKQDKIPFRVVTAHNYVTIDAKVRRILNIYNGNITWDDIIVASDKSIINGSIMIDDNINNLLNNKFIKTRLLFARPHNHKYKNDPRIYYVKDFDEINEILGYKGIIDNEYKFFKY